MIFYLANVRAFGENYTRDVVCFVVHPLSACQRTLYGMRYKQADVLLNYALSKTQPTQETGLTMSRGIPTVLSDFCVCVCVCVCGVKGARVCAFACVRCTCVHACTS